MSAICYIWAINQADVAQLDRAFGYEPKGSRFESWHPQKKGDLRQASRLFLFDRNQARNWSLCEQMGKPICERMCLNWLFYMNSAHPVYIPLQVRVLAPAERKAFHDK